MTADSSNFNKEVCSESENKKLSKFGVGLLWSIKKLKIDNSRMQGYQHNLYSIFRITTHL